MKPARTPPITMCVIFGVLTSCTANGVVPSQNPYSSGCEIDHSTDACIGSNVLPA